MRPRCSLRRADDPQPRHPHARPHAVGGSGRTRRPGLSVDRDGVAEPVRRQDVVPGRQVRPQTRTEPVVERFSLYSSLGLPPPGLWRMR